MQAIRAAFEYSGQKCSALARVYVPRSLWEGGFQQTLVDQVNKITIGPCTSWDHFTGPVIAKHSFDKITGIIEKAKKDGGEVIAGGKCEWSERKNRRPRQVRNNDPSQGTTRRVSSSSLPSSSQRTPSRSP